MVSSPLGVAILGCGHRPHAWSYARALTASSVADLVGVSDPSPELGQSVAADFGVPWHTDPAALVESDRVRAVVVCSPTAEHRELVEMAARRGLHVLCEKPIATTIDDARAMLRACEANGVQLHTAFVARFQPRVQHIRRAVADGQVGELVALRAGNRGRPPLPPHYPAWITTAAESGGGALMDHSVHLTDVLRHVSGREVTRVSAEVGEQLWHCGVDDVALLSLELEGGVVAALDPSWSVPEGNPWDYDFYLRLVGTQGSADVHDRGESVQLVTGAGLRLVSFAEDPDRLMIEAFVRSVQDGRVTDPCATGEDGLRALEVALAGYAAARDATTVQLPSP